ncbi:MAG: hypothetical protein JO332_13240 [Planctomycetaceae bacterium]|nr:hypothetical protein [Planctomycetaceae bacterium]
MRRYCWLLLLCGCAGASSWRPEGPLDRLIATSNAYSSFHLNAEINDGKQTVYVEMAYQAPDRAVLKYGNIATTVLGGGKARYFLRGTYSVLDTAAVVEELKARYPGLPIGKAPEPVFTLGDGVRALLSVGRLGARLGWLEELRAYSKEGNIYRHGQTEIVLRDDGFIERTSLAGTTFTLKSVVIGTPLPDALFEPPSTAGLQDTSARLQPLQTKELEDAYHRWVLKTSIADETLETLVRVDLARKHEPEKLAAVLDENLRKSVATFRTLHPDARPEILKDKLVIDRGRAMGSVEIMEDEIVKGFEKDLDGYFRGMPEPPPQKVMLDVSRRWTAAVKRQVDEQIRSRFAAVFEAVEKN